MELSVLFCFVLSSFFFSVFFLFMSRSFWDFLFVSLFGSPLKKCLGRGAPIYCVRYSEGPFKLETQVLQAWDMFLN